MVSGPMISPYSESLLVHFRRMESLKEEAIKFPSVDLNKRQLCDLELLLNRAFYPLDGYLNQEDHESVLDTMRLTDGTVWPMPVCLDVDEDFAATLRPGLRVAVRDKEGFMLAVLEVGDVWRADKEREAQAVFGTADAEKHPGVRRFYEQVKPWYVGGKLEGLHLPQHYDFPELRMMPSETHRLFSRRGWRNVIGFHTEGHLHRAHKEMILRAAREAGAGIFIQPVVGRPGLDDMDHFTLVRCCREFVKKFPKNMAMVGLITMAARLAGPREALWQAIVRRNFGCTHFMVADDHADPLAVNGTEDSFYPKGRAQELVLEFADEIDIKPVSVKRMVYVEDKAQYIPEDEVRPGMDVKSITPEELRRRLEFDLEIPRWFSFPEVTAELRKAYPPRHRQGFTIFLSGLSGAGKSTLAKVLQVKFMEMRDRPVTLLDGDIVRKNLSSELTYTKEHRNLNITRIGFVASEITKNRGIAICAPIAPYEESRRVNRELIGAYGGYVEVYMSTPIEVCEQRDRKGIYAKARAGMMKGVTGVDDPYVPPSNPELTLDTTNLSPTEAAQEVLLYLGEQGYMK